MSFIILIHFFHWFFQGPLPDPADLDLSGVNDVFIPVMWSFANHIVNHLLVLVGIRSGVFFGMNILKQVGSMMGG